MPKKKNFKNKRKKSSNISSSRSLLEKEAEQEYALVKKMLGDRRIMVYCYNGLETMGKIRGRIRKKTRISEGDVVLVSFRDFSDKCVDVIHVYNHDEVRNLKKMGELIDPNKQDEDEDDVVFEKNEEIDFEDL